MQLMRISRFVILGALIAAQAGMSATVSTYTYDARGRLNVACQATPWSGSRTAYSLDRSDNRANVTSYDPSVVITAGSAIYSADGRFYLTLQTDGNLVLYGPSGALWATYTVGSGASQAVLQSYGNLVVYTSTGGVVWWNGIISHCANLVVQNDGNLAIYSTSGAVVWQTNTGGH